MLLLDEPLGALDLKLREEMQVELKELQRDVGITFVFVTHDQEEALTMSDRIAVFNEGRIEQVGPPVEVYERPATPFVAGFVGTSNMLDRGDRAAGRRRGRGVQRAAGEDPAPPRPRRGRTRRTARSSGTVVEVVYLGSSTHSVVDVGEGVHLTVLQQNQRQLHRPRARPPWRDRRA